MEENMPHGSLQDMRSTILFLSNKTRLPVKPFLQ